jgi:hypothetical protein
MTDTPTIPRWAPAPPVPPADVQALGRLIGTWRVWGGGAEGTVTYEWLDGGFFLLQNVDLRQDGEPIRGVEIIGREPPDDDGPVDIQSRYYDSAGNTFDYVYELEGDTLTIWAGERGSPAYYRGVFATDGTTLTGRWVYPGGGSDDMTAVRVA